MHRDNSEFLHGDLTHGVLAAAIEVHRALGPGLLENTYRRCLTHELQLAGMTVKQEVPVSLEYKGIAIENAYRADVIVDGAVLIELKCVEKILPVHRAQVATYLRFLGLRVGLLLNFNETRLPEGIRRVFL